MAELEMFKCPRCDGRLEFDAVSQKLKCPFCDSTFGPEELKKEPSKTEAADTPAKWEPDTRGWENAAEDGIRVYTCRTCGGEILCEETTAATACPFCDNPVVLSDRVKGLLRPDCVIPFQITKAQATAELKKYVRAKRFAPRKFYAENHLREIKGVYVPFWLFDSRVDAEIHFDATKVRRWSDSSYYYVETSHYNVVRSGSMEFKNVPVDGSKKMPDDLMDSIEPFFPDKAVDFSPAYLTGFLADKYDVPLKESMKRADARTKNSAREALKKHVDGYHSVIPNSQRYGITPKKARYALFPVWLLRTEYRSNIYTFAMNGQTGKFIGNLPISTGSLAGLFGCVAAGVSAAVFLLGLLIGLF